MSQSRCCPDLAHSRIGTNLYGYAYDSIGNRQWASANAVTNAYAVNCLNQYAQVDSAQIVRRYDDSGWQSHAAHAFVYDGCNIVLERIAFADGSTRTIEYFWGNDLSGMEQSAGNAPVAKRSGCLNEANPQGRKGPRVGGLLAVSIDGSFYIPCYDHNGNIVCYVSESGTIAAQYVYDPYGNVIEQYGALADKFAIRFSTKYHDAEIGLISYLYRFYRPDHGRWLNRDPIEERGGENLYAFCANQPTCYIDAVGLDFKGEFISAIQTLGGLCTIAGGLSLGVGTSWTGVGGAVGLGIFALGLDQFAAGLQNLQRAVNDEKISDATPVKTFYRTSLNSIAGDVGADIASKCDTVYGYASLASSCYGGVVSFNSIVSSTKWILVPARTVKVPVVERHFIRYTFELRASYWKLSTGAEGVMGTFELIVTGAGYIASPEPDSQLPDNMMPVE